MYDPTPARFLSEDPLGFESGDTNVYRYVLNSPINYTDPTGERPAPVVTPERIVAPTTQPAPFRPRIPGLGVAGGTAIILLQDLLFPAPANLGEDEFLEQLNCSEGNSPQNRRRCEFVHELPGRPDSVFKICAYDCLGYGALATFAWPKDLPCPGSFDDLFPPIPPGYPDPNVPRN